MTKNIVILAAGASSRMKKSEVTAGLSSQEIDAANLQSKALIEIGDSKRPLLDFILLNVKKAGLKNVILVVGESYEGFKNFYGKELRNNSWNGLNISYAIQKVPVGALKPMGTADALLQAMLQFPELSKASFLVCNGDNLYSVEAIQNLVNSNSAQGMIAYDRDGLKFDSERISKFALCKLDNQNNLVAISEKPEAHKFEAHADAQGFLSVSMNLWKLDRNIQPNLENCPIHPIRKEKELPTAILKMIREGTASVTAIPMSEHVPDLTSKADIIVLKEYLKNYPN
ncbi:MAG: NTP transferase domain-containing protein [Flavobacteriaceae bacterium]|nr:NTP transferase domain-containing protein [Flavobacteriaceae bacterium]